MRLKYILIAIFSVMMVTTTAPSCKAVGKVVVKHWTRKQKKKFIAKCKDGAVKKFGDKANEYCTCLGDVAEEEFPKFEDAMAMDWFTMAKMLKDCVKK